MTNPITRAHRLSVARAWEGDAMLPVRVQQWVHDGLIASSTAFFGNDGDLAALERLAQLVADAEGSCWIPVSAGLPDSDIVVQARCADDSGDIAVVTLEFTDDSEGHGEPYWRADGGDLALCNYPQWRPLPAKPSEQP